MVWVTSAVPSVPPPQGLKSWLQKAHVLSFTVHGCRTQITAPRLFPNWIYCTHARRKDFASKPYLPKKHNAHRQGWNPHGRHLFLWNTWTGKNNNGCYHHPAASRDGTNVTILNFYKHKWRMWGFHQGTCIFSQVCEGLQQSFPEHISSQRWELHLLLFLKPQKCKRISW